MGIHDVNMYLLLQYVCPAVNVRCKWEGDMLFIGDDTYEVGERVSLFSRQQRQYVNGMTVHDVKSHPSLVVFDILPHMFVLFLF